MGNEKKPILPLTDKMRGIYRHSKGGVYRLLFLAHHSETLEDMVVYEPLISSTGYWVRPREMWDEIVEKDGQSQPRFSFLAKDEDALDELDCFPILNRRAEALRAQAAKDEPAAACLPLARFRRAARAQAEQEGEDWTREYCEERINL